jgi:hypothetical protein
MCMYKCCTNRDIQIDRHVEPFFPKKYLCIGYMCKWITIFTYILHKFGHFVVQRCIVRPWPTLKPSEKCSFLTLTHFLTPKFSFQAEWMAPFDSHCSSVSELNAPF